jgi:hypothetical protein
VGRDAEQISFGHHLGFDRAHGGSRASCGEGFLDDLDQSFVSNPGFVHAEQGTSNEQQRSEGTKMKSLPWG